ncbi:hypothetical protein BDF22DRAFT_665586 [Syncephalis plumigaleata]|nr:hypothetical protein BDF22DRAFT_665586 [Syncephalis plumigaleata]
MYCTNLVVVILLFLTPSPALSLSRAHILTLSFFFTINLSFFLYFVCSYLIPAHCDYCLFSLAVSRRSSVDQLNDQASKQVVCT